MTKQQAELINAIIDSAINGTPINLSKEDLVFSDQFSEALAMGKVSVVN